MIRYMCMIIVISICCVSFVYSNNDIDSVLDAELYAVDSKDVNEPVLGNKIRKLGKNIDLLGKSNSVIKHTVMNQIHALCSFLKIKITGVEKTQTRSLFNKIIETVYSGTHSAKTYDIVSNYIDSSINITEAELEKDKRSEEKQKTTVYLYILKNEKRIRTYSESFYFTSSSRSVVPDDQRYELTIDAIKQSLHSKAKKDLGAEIDDLVFEYAVDGARDFSIEEELGL